MDPQAVEGRAGGEEPRVGAEPAGLGVGVEFGQPGPDPVGEKMSSQTPYSELVT